MSEYGALEAARTLAKCADDLEAWFDELLTPAEAEGEGMGDAETIGRKLRAGKLHNHGRKFSPRVRRGDLLHVSDDATSLAPALKRQAINTMMEGAEDGRE